MDKMAKTLAEIAAKLNLASGLSALPAVIFITDRAVYPDPFVVMADLPRGSMVVLRDYDQPDRPAMARKMAAFCKQAGLSLLIAGDVALAREVGADGVHLPGHMLYQARALGQRFPHWIITAAVHNLPQLRHAAQGGVNAVLLSPVFPTLSHRETYNLPGRTLGRLRFAALLARAPLPVYALGGMTSTTAMRLQGLVGPLAGIAAIRGWADKR